MYITLPEIVNDGERTKISVSFESSQGKGTLWYSINKKYGEFLPADLADAFVIGLLLKAMKYGEDIYTEGKISEKLFYNITNYLTKIFTLLLPSLNPIKIFPKELTNEFLVKPFAGVVTGFSGGIDSFCTFIDHLCEDTPKSYKITHLFFNNVGSHGEGGRQLFQKRYERLVKFAEEYELPLIKIDSNLDEVLDMNFQNTHTPRNISAALLLQKLFSKYYYSSAHKYQDCIIGESPDGAVIDPAAIHLFSTENIECISTGCQYSRVEKTRKVADFEPSYDYLDVCVNTVENAENCSQCWKCARTLLTLEILGKHQLYERVFNLQKYYEIRETYINSLKDSSSPLTKEVIELASSTGYNLNLNR